MSAIKLAPAVRLLWAKTGPKDTWHPLWCHMVDVGSVALRRFERTAPAQRRAVAGWLGCDEELAGRLVAVLAALHDLGKCSPAFQGKAPARVAALRAEGVSAWPRDLEAPHPHFGAEFGPYALQSVWGTGRPTKSLRFLVQCAAIHHGGYDPADGVPGALDWFGREAKIWLTMAFALCGTVCEVFGVRTLPSEATAPQRKPRLFPWLAGFVSVCDWIGSSTERFPFAAADVGVRMYAKRSSKRAHDALDAIDLDARPRFPGRSFEARFGLQPRPLQREVRALVDDVREGPVLLVVESPMGEGKTEAALDACAELVERLGLGGFFVGLPTQATSNAMHARVQAWIEAATGGPVRVRLAHGSAWLRSSRSPVATGHRGDAAPPLGGARVYGPGGDPRGEALDAAAWFTSSKRALLEACGVGTIDQALLGVLPARHGFVRLGALSGRVVVLDEVHAYDAYTGHLLKRLVAWLGAQGACVILLSATLPSSTRREILDEWSEATGQCPEAPEEAAYPRVTLRAPGLAKSIHVEPTPGRRRTVRLEHVDDDAEAVARSLLSRLEEGGCGAWICNTVARAQRAWEVMRAAAGPGVEVSLFHARFTARDRATLEERAKRDFGIEGPRPHRAVLVATQVVEQSLDLDFDVMVSDLAPADLVLQRAGRLHRHERPIRPPRVREPLLALVGAADETDTSSPVYGLVYERSVLLRSRGALARPEVTVPDDIEPIVEDVYVRHDVDRRVPEAVGEEIARSALKDGARGQAHQARAESRVLHHPARGIPWEGLTAPRLDEEGEEGDPTSTRLGEPSLAIAVLHDVGGRTCLGPGGEDPVDGTGPVPDALARKIAAASLTVSRRALRGAAQEVQHAAPPSWHDAPLLRRTGAVVLQGGRARIGGLSIRYDDRMGWRVEPAGGAP